jgi:hypothetical protein
MKAYDLDFSTDSYRQIFKCQLILADSAGSYIKTLQTTYDFQSILKEGDSVMLEEFPEYVFRVIGRHVCMRLEEISISLKRI